MKFNIDHYLSNPNELTPEVLSDAETSVREAENVVRKATQAYNDELAGRQTNLDKQADELEVKLKKAKAMHDMLATKVTDATSRGDIDSAGRADEKLEEVGRTISALERKYRLTTGARLAGDTALYNTCKDAMDTANIKAEEYRQNLEELQAIAVNEAKRLNEVADTINQILGYGGMWPKRTDFVRNARAEFTAVERHYKDLDRIEAEACARAAEERKAEHETNKRITYTIS